MPFFSQRCTSQARLDGKTAVVTGCNTGIGKCTVADFYKRGARVVMACRDLSKANETKEEIIKSVSNEQVGKIITIKLDLSSLASVRECAKDLLKNESQINILVNNAGVMMCPFGKTEDNFETQLGTNHLGHFLFTLLLLPKIKNSTPARIVNVSSDAYKRGKINFEDPNFEKTPYKPFAAYGQSKLANILFSSELSRKLKENNIDGITTYSLHPGVIKTELGRHIRKDMSRIATGFLNLVSWVFKTPEQGAQTTIFCAVDETAGLETGLFYKECAVTSLQSHAEDKAVAKKLWDMSVEMVKLGDYDPFNPERIVQGP